ncbi:hypothetical protein FZC28_6968g5542 [Saccharomyces cerevisiae]|nr:hypothetical protein FZC28_6968g5542 [Saccharomyces cerevisiae]KAJ1056028.1 hypothetical protein FZC27_7613g810 [Saccharomyces cerevisiae]
MTSALRVLVCGDHPNLILYTSRFQHAKNIEFYLVNNSKNANYEVSSLFYGTERFQIQNHFQSLLDLVDLNNENSGLVFDLIIMSASSLQEIPQVLRDIKPMMNKTTKILFESSGFIYLEPFIKASVDLSLSNIFSIFTDYDIRRLDNGSYKQFTNANAKSFSVSIGQTTSVYENSYSSDIIPILNTFQKLFQKLFPRDVVTLYDHSPSAFLAKEWELALPQICFDPLLIILEEKNPSTLDDHVLAKPLISGLLGESLLIIKKMGIAMNNPNFQNEQTILKHWKNKCEDLPDGPALLYNFIHKASSLNIDLLLLQPILLADDFGVKTPYLECLFTMMTQYQLLNKGDSEWFIRKDENTALTRVDDLQNSIALKDGKIMQLQNSESTLKNEIKELQSQVLSLKQEVSSSKANNEQELEILKKKVQMGDNSLFDRPNSNTNGISPSDNIVDVDLNYERSDQGNNSSGNDSRRQSFFNSTSDTTLSRDETSLKERELEVRMKELELQERELELQRKALQQQQQYQQRPPKQVYSGPSGTPTSGNNNNKSYNPNRKSSYSRPQHVAMMTSRGLHGPSAASSSPVISANNFVDPVSSGTPYSSNSSRFSQQIPSQQYMHTVKPTSRKNRSSVMPNIGYVPGLTNNEYGRKFNGNGMNGTQSRLNSLSNQSTFRSQQGPPITQQKSFQNNGGSMRTNRIPSASYNISNQQSGFVNSISSPNLSNLENRNTVQNSRNADSAPCVNQLNSDSPPQLQSLSQNGTSKVPQINITQPSPIRTNFATSDNPAAVIKLGTPSEDTVSAAATANNISTMGDESRKEDVKEKKKKKFSFFGKRKK